jgi:ABC-2 type transport system ATP-binding protein
MSDDFAIKVEHVSKDFSISSSRANTLKSVLTGFHKEKQTEKNTQRALKDINFEVKKGEFFGIVGRNGSGKSTLLKIIAGIYQPNKGKVHVRGKLVPFIELGVGFNPDLTGRENVYMNGALLGFSEEEVDGFYDEVVRFAELERFMDKKLKNYSSGMQVRLAFAMAIRAKADVLLIDEVLAVGDADFQRKCYEYFQRIKAEGITVVFVTHDMGAVRQYCDRVALIDRSRLVEVSDAETAAKKYMQLFSEEEPSTSQTAIQANRWGNQKAKYEKVTIKLVDNGQNVIIKATVKANADIKDPTYGFMVSNEAKQPILGTNSKIEQAKYEPLKSGQRVEVQWKFPNIFNEGKLSVELVIMYKSITEVADWWENAQSINVTNDKRTPYIVNPVTEFSIEEI